MLNVEKQKFSIAALLNGTCRHLPHCRQKNFSFIMCFTVSLLLHLLSSLFNITCTLSFVKHFYRSNILCPLTFLFALISSWSYSFINIRHAKCMIQDGVCIFTNLQKLSFLRILKKKYKRQVNV